MEGKCKIRKTGGSSSSSSSLARRCSLNRAIMLGKKAGSTTPVPWKPQRAGSSSPLSKEVGGKGFSVSARKLGATLWEINEVAGDEEEKEEEVVDDGGSCEEHLTGSPVQFVPPRAYDLRQSPVTESKKDHRRRSCNHSRRASANLQSRDLLQVRGNDLVEVKEVESSCKKTCLKEVRDCLHASKELVKVLCLVGGLAKRTSPTLSLVSALYVELDRAFVQMERLMNEEWSRWGEFGESSLMKRFAEEKARWRCKVRERVRNEGRRMAKEVETERKLRCQTERMNKKLGEELTGTKSALYRISKELQSERRTKEILQQVCDELSRGIGEDRAHVEEQKRESDKVLGEVEKEREMLQLEKIEEVQVYLRSRDSTTLENGGDAGDDSADGDLQSIELNMVGNTRSFRCSFLNDESDREGDEPRRSSVDRMFKGRKSLSEKINWASISLSRAAHDDTVVAAANPKADFENQRNTNGFRGKRLIDFFTSRQE